MIAYTKALNIIKEINLKDLKDCEYLGCFPRGYFIKSLKVVTSEKGDDSLLAKILDDKKAEIICDIDCATLEATKEKDFYVFSKELKDLFLYFKNDSDKATKGKLTISFELVCPSEQHFEFK